MEQISIFELKERLPSLSKKDLILDVREPDEFEEGRVPGARNIPMGDVTHYAKELAEHEKIYVYCHAGRRSQMASIALEKAGLTNLICVSGGGMGDWMDAGFPFEK
ncbi:MAG: rhodanese-like domain-containing protein [Bdellovibrionales bacterium]|nr:rhodanese-like domain-containing protein [Bdellovibrionales bacterium]